MFGWIEYLLIAAGAGGLAWLSLRVTRLKPTTPGPWCAACGYSLYGIDRWGRCPECGTELQVKTPHYAWPVARRWRWPAIIGWTAAMVLLTMVVERTVMLKYRSASAAVHFHETNLRHAAFDADREESKYDKLLYQFTYLRRGREWFVGTEADFWPLISWRNFKSYRLILDRMTVTDRHSEAELDYDTHAMTFTRRDGQSVTFDNGLTVEAMLTWWKEAGMDVSHPQIRADVIDFVSTMRSRMLQDPPEYVGKYWNDSGRVSVGWWVARTPWFLLLPYLALASWLWWRGARRIWRAAA